jgi:hypothetical protein
MAAAHEFIELPGDKSFLGERGVRLPAASASASRRARDAKNRRCCCWTRPPAPSTRNQAAGQGALERRWRPHDARHQRIAGDGQRATRIIVLDNGRIVETGTHARWSRREDLREPRGAAVPRAGLEHQRSQHDAEHEDDEEDGQCDEEEHLAAIPEVRGHADESKPAMMRSRRR